VDNKQFDLAILDYDECLKLMSEDGENKDGMAVYGEYPDTFVGKLTFILHNINKPFSLYYHIFFCYLIIFCGNNML
jgi:hypothetical protein